MNVKTSVKGLALSMLSDFSYSIGLESETARKRSQLGNTLLTLTVCGFIAAVAYADSKVDEISLGYLYILPIALSGLINRLPTSILFVVVSVILHDIFGPPHALGERIVLNIMASLAFTVVALLTNRMGKEREAMSNIIRRQHAELEKEIHLASRVQQRLLPSEAPQFPGIEVACGITYLKEMGGDYYDFIEINNDECGIAIADVSGKGTAAAIVMPAIEAALRMEALNSQDVGQGLQNLNKVICEVTENARFVTLFYGLLRFSTKTLEFINAGHNPPFLYSQKTGRSEWLDAVGPPVGLFAGAAYASKILQLELGDILVLYTDGLSEAEDSQGDIFSKSRIAKTTIENASRSAQEIFDRLMSDVVEFSGYQNFEDDLTLIVIKLVS
ncbi:MAG: PP2C family protein-serine/threonine phosphatase [Acidobacteriota bacterium]